jgi:hypothetical protein
MLRHTYFLCQTIIFHVLLVRIQNLLPHLFLPPVHSAIYLYMDIRKPYDEENYTFAHYRGSTAVWFQCQSARPPTFSLRILKTFLHFKVEPVHPEGPHLPRPRLLGDTAYHVRVLWEGVEQLLTERTALENLGVVVLVLWTRKHLSRAVGPRDGIGGLLTDAERGRQVGQGTRNHA